METLLTILRSYSQFPLASRQVLSLLLTSFLLWGCARPINRAAERRIRDVLPTYIGPAQVWRAHVDSAPERTLQGRLRRIVIEGEQVQLRQTITCDSLRIEMQDVVVDTRSHTLLSVGTTNFHAVLGERNVNEYLHRFPPSEEEPVRIRRVRLEKGRIHMEATRWLLGKAWPYTITAEPRLISETRLLFEPERMSILGVHVPLPTNLLRFLARYLSDGFDFRTLPFPVQIHRFSVEQGKIRLEGTAEVMRSLNEKLSADAAEIGR
jgi:hypothetical protein